MQGDLPTRSFPQNFHCANASFKEATRTRAFWHLQTVALGDSKRATTHTFDVLFVCNCHFAFGVCGTFCEAALRGAKGRDVLKLASLVANQQVQLNEPSCLIEFATCCVENAAERGDPSLRARANNSPRHLDDERPLPRRDDGRSDEQCDLDFRLSITVPRRRRLHHSSSFARVCEARATMHAARRLLAPRVCSRQSTALSPKRLLYWHRVQRSAGE